MKDLDTTESADTVRDKYSKRRQSFESAAARSSRRGMWSIGTSASCIVVIALLFLIRTELYSQFIALLVILALIALWQFRTFLRHRRQAIDAAHRGAFYERGMDRIDGKWAGKVGWALSLHAIITSTSMTSRFLAEDRCLSFLRQRVLLPEQSVWQRICSTL